VHKVSSNIYLYDDLLLTKLSNSKLWIQHHEALVSDFGGFNIYVLKRSTCK
jgi:hypothetical protein